jgi:hypothetical protein
MRRTPLGMAGLLVAWVLVVLTSPSTVTVLEWTQDGAPAAGQSSIPPLAPNADGRILQGATDQRAMAAPGRNTIYSCTYARMGEARAVPWVSDTGVIHLNRKPSVPGEVARDAEGLSIEPNDVGVWLSGDGLPQHPTGAFPVPLESEAYQYDRNPNSIRARDWVLILPAEPELAAEPSCLPMGPIAIALSGAMFFNALDAQARDAVANELFDLCEGHPEANGQYHYHHDSPCFVQGNPIQHSPLVGYALDGVGLYGPRGVDGQVVSNAELDECHGHLGPVVSFNGELIVIYHYHLNGEFPYSLGCYRGAEIARVPFGPPPGPPRP